MVVVMPTMALLSSPQSAADSNFGRADSDEAALVRPSRRMWQAAGCSKKFARKMFVPANHIGNQA